MNTSYLGNTMINAKKSTKFLLCSVAFVGLAACSSDSNNTPNFTQVDLSFSDAAVDGATEVVISVERITFRRNNNEDIAGSDDGLDAQTDVEVAVDAGEGSDELSHSNVNEIVVDTFVSADGSEAESFTLDLLTVQGEDKRLVIDSVELPVGEYSNMLIEVVDESLNQSYVVDANGLKPLKVPSNVLKLGGFSIEPTSKQSMVVEFGLQQSMTYNPGNDRYILKPRGVRIVSVDAAALVTGTIDHAALQINDGCEALETGGTSGSLYLYQGHVLDPSLLADNFNPDIETDATSRFAPVASSSLNKNSFPLSYLEPGDYTLAISCNNEFDDADFLEDLPVPNPADQIFELTVAAGQALSCGLPLGEQACVDANNDTGTK